MTHRVSAPRRIVLGALAALLLVGALAPGTSASTSFTASLGSHGGARWTWWAAGEPGWWDDVAANGGGHYSVTPTNGNTYTGDTVNMNMIKGDF